ncbi:MULTISPECIES: hypothetical protein [Oceanobacillus]|uniref:Uncharacterized protein n=1 Tax=Oceanobacillus kimchii TaxID=746691 RepID=A0ABQ5TD98_9BACI|nr:MULTISPECIES: hypothetical protein [Oceanobacillus]MBT2653024.1 hypothetical protein [Oceanobacillus sp. ISL-73]MCT1577628.1 hypothetical protein [Oceanobacillus kimchii]MCT2136616.1 hypothetical protein [Oceanobacillus kimchii]OEH53757.1 hypothetical protein AQ616_14850 [Oceanobacillus sp. E9]GLO64653.1 hypothetical protein MACH08_04370 [Oceanobacillus kimchii]
MNKRKVTLSTYTISIILVFLLFIIDFFVVSIPVGYLFVSIFAILLATTIGLIVYFSIKTE